MRPGNNNNNRRGRNRGPRKPHGGVPNKNQNFDGGGSDTRVRGNVYQVLEKYLQLARDAGVAGDRVAAENFLQHADHYYRVITTMNDGQRPRVGGREISVADVNVQNVSQGLSAALYSGGPSQPNMSDGGSSSAPQQGNGNPRNNDFSSGQNNDHRNSHDGNAQGSNAHSGDNVNRDGQGRDNQARDVQTRDGQGRDNNSRGNNAGDEDNSGEYVQPAPHRGNRGRNSNAGGRNTYGNSGQPPVQPPVQPQGAAAPETASRELPLSPPPAPVQTSDDQPDYPEHLLPPATPEAGTENVRPREGSASPRAPRGRLRVRRPRHTGAEGEGEAPADTPVPGPVGDGGE